MRVPPGRVGPAVPGPAAAVRLTFLAAAALCLAAAEATSQDVRRTIAGTISDSSGGAVVGAEVAFSGVAGRVLSDASGNYRLRDIPRGPGQLSVRRLGFRPAVVDLTVSESAETRADVRLVPLPQRLATVQVRERREVYASRLAGFNERAARRKGGYFVTRDRIDRAHSQRFVDLLREIPGVRIRPMRGWGTVVQLRGASCPPLVFVDGFPASAAPLDLDVIDVATVEGIEVYSSMASVPSEFLSPRALDRCGVIAIWSRPARPRHRGMASTSPVDLAELVAARAVFTAEQVDIPAQLEDGTARPIYPDSLWRAQVAGRVVVEFVVDTSGAVEAATVGIVSSTHPAFADATRVAIAGARFVAARLQGRPVRQLVQLPFAFQPVALR